MRAHLLPDEDEVRHRAQRHLERVRLGLGLGFGFGLGLGLGFGFGFGFGLAFGLGVGFGFWLGWRHLEGEVRRLRYISAISPLYLPSPRG